MQIENCKLENGNCLRRSTPVIDDVFSFSRELDASRSENSDARRGYLRFEGRALPSKRICNFHFSFFNFQFAFLTALAILCIGFVSEASAQIVPDKIVATVTNGSQATPDVITYSDLVWQLALEPGHPSLAHPSSEELKAALDTLVQQTLVLQEAKKLPLAQTGDAQKNFDKKVQEPLNEVISSLGSRAVLDERMKQVGLTSEQLDQILRDRQTMDSYVDFRFRAFAVVSTKEISDRYEKTYLSQRGSGRI